MDKVMKVNQLLSYLLCVSSLFVNVRVDSKDLDIFDLESSTYEVISLRSGYFPVLNRLENRLFCVIRDGGGHLGIGGYLVLLRSFPYFVKWEKPITITNSPVDDRNPAVGFASNNRLIVAYQEQGSYNSQNQYDASLKNTRTMVVWSDDYGTTWGEPKVIEGLGIDGASPYGKIIPLQDGSYVMNVYGEYSRTLLEGMNISNQLDNYAYLIRSMDNGETWDKPSLIAGGHNETGILLLENGLLVAASRSIGSQKVDVMLSEDQGMTWSTPVKVTNANQHPADLLQLSNGWVMMFFGDRSVDEKMIRALISRDNCRSWDIGHEVLLTRPVDGDFGYPSAAKMPDGRIAVAHYWAGYAKDAYDGSNARSAVTYFNEKEFITAYEKFVAE
jgi:hypothetical protein